jgi:hypothetical protein
MLNYLTEKWKRLKKLRFPERKISSHIVRSAAHLAGQSAIDSMEMQ